MTAKVLLPGRARLATLLLLALAPSCACLRLAVRPSSHSSAASAASRVRWTHRTSIIACSEAASDLDLDEVWWEDMLTCVEFEDSAGVLRLGVYCPYSVTEENPHIRPLCASSEDDGVSALLADEEAPPAPLTAVRRVLDPDYVFVSERQAGGGQGLGNPHGEHGESCYDLRDLPDGLSAALQLVVREGRDTERVL